MSRATFPPGLVIYLTTILKLNYLKQRGRTNVWIKNTRFEVLLRCKYYARELFSRKPIINKILTKAKFNYFSHEMVECLLFNCSFSDLINYHTNH